jgi:hypothetical protein
MLVKDGNEDVVLFSVLLDLSNCTHKLGSFTATLEWDPVMLEYVRHLPGATKGFDKPVVNTVQAKSGKLRFACANPEGGEGLVNILTLVMERRPLAGGGGGRVSMAFSALAAASTFRDLMPYLEVRIGNDQQGGEGVPTEYRLENFPNPFNPTTRIQYQVPRAGFVDIVVFNPLGQRVRQLVHEHVGPGNYSIDWNGVDDHGAMVPSGVYIIRMVAGDVTLQQKSVLIK